MNDSQLVTSPLSTALHDTLSSLLLCCASVTVRLRGQGEGRRERTSGPVVRGAEEVLRGHGQDLGGHGESVSQWEIERG